jgi:hypothetical protein
MDEKTKELVRDLVDIIDEELLPNAAGIAIQDFGRLNSTLIEAREFLNS